MKNASGPSSKTVEITREIGRQTRQKRALTAVLEESDQFLSAQQLHAALRQRGESVGLTTVYGQLRSLSEAGLLSVLRTESGELLYRRCESMDHHHHLVCRSCGASTEIQAPELETWAIGVALSHGYKDVTHTFAILGTCPECAATG